MERVYKRKRRRLRRSHKIDLNSKQIQSTTKNGALKSNILLLSKKNPNQNNNNYNNNNKYNGTKTNKYKRIVRASKDTFDCDKFDLDQKLHAAFLKHLVMDLDGFKIYSRDSMLVDKEFKNLIKKSKFSDVHHYCSHVSNLDRNVAFRYSKCTVNVDQICINYDNDEDNVDDDIDIGNETVLKKRIRRNHDNNYVDDSFGLLKYVLY